MAKTMNPYAEDYTRVSNSRAVIERTPTCSCCSMEFYWKGPASKVPGDPSPCPRCATHRMDDPTPELEARREHDRRFIELLAKARGSARAAHRATQEVRDSLEREVRQRAEATAAALRSRDRYRAILSAIEQEHWVDAGSTNGHCACGVDGCKVSALIDEVRDKQRERGIDGGRIFEPGDIRELLALADERAREHWMGRTRPQAQVECTANPDGGEAI